MSNEQGSSTGGTNITLADAVLSAIRKNALEMFIHLPGIVESFDEKTQTISVQPAIDRILNNGTVIKYPILADVPVLYPTSKAGGFAFPLAKGDHVLLCFAQRSLDKWKYDGAGFPPADNRIFDISDAIAIPGSSPIKEPISIMPSVPGIWTNSEIHFFKSKKPTEPAVLGSKLQKNLEDLIKAIDDLTTLLDLGIPIANPSDGKSVITTTPIHTALAAVKSALPSENSQIVKLE